MREHRRGRKFWWVTGEQALVRLLGVSPEGAHDEFDAVDLGKYRNTADWIS
jgi:hypothetical protein